VITNQTGQAVWRYDNNDPFGGNVPDENPAGLGIFTCNLRFPGQYFDQETNTHYNYFRDYDPTIGRYVQSDPIGLRGGLNTYLYVEANPIGDIDVDGLQVRNWSRTQALRYALRKYGNTPGVVQGVNCAFALNCEQFFYGGTTDNHLIFEQCKFLAVPGGGGRGLGELFDNPFENCRTTCRDLLFKRCSQKQACLQTGSGG
jgi:RHS repeat-associated protein